ncbi:hypothetical protein CCAX7_54260 [Capsulimonas corticalis]|uniref:Uncharacterized protein n=1 Tax=Capsulimonas corticalis TaxID=2219043 RepID=A0A402CN60_9BACT|nr:hypothetical protein [Capsulimonas corticalis]BDI33375.1 hypothetical protein CCAX7_54260 [Capsulimonas corticalis]
MQPLLKAGLSQGASDAFRRAGVTGAMIGQTIGLAKASAGEHKPETTLDNGHQYSAATDLHIQDLNDQRVKYLLTALSLEGFACYYRDPGRDHWPTKDARHIHAVYCGVPMKESLRNQAHSWLAGKNGLLSNAPYLFWQPSAKAQAIVRTLFLAHNPADN